MDNDLERSVRILEDALSTTRTSLFKNTSRRSRVDQKKSLDLSVHLNEHEYKRMLMSEGISIYDDTVTRILQGNLTVTGEMLQANILPWKTTLDSLNTEFFEVLQVHSGIYDNNI